MNVLLSIHPKYADRILSGSKKYEFRKSLFQSQESIQEVYLYSTSPVQEIVGKFSIKNVVEDTPQHLWDRFKTGSGLSRQEFFTYFEGTERGIAIEIKDVEVFDEPIDPHEVFPEFNAPQSFCYLDPSFLSERQSSLEEAP